VHLPAGPPILTAALVGSSGVGKSTLANALLGADLLAVGDIRVTDGKGRHTTTRRELLPIPGGGLLLDTPGMREFGLWGEGIGPVETFTDVEEIAQGCRFRDCAHAREPACAVRDAIAAGILTPARVDSWRKLRRETRKR
jgi:ribosome biogenesis GTPase